MLVDYPLEWEKYFLRGKGRVFSKDTPKDVVEKAKMQNELIYKRTGKIFFKFEE
ncbi:hypothetical protein [Ruminococcus sp.]|uniref:hypothetical protein n=1 Tax=Ruminococcus sp. TaxID=41978 RepID=UPI0025EAEEC5|nr:hypothetical protein [Ruminococcus sp.]